MKEKIRPNDITDAEAAALARTMVKLFSAWDVSDAQACTLLGAISPDVWDAWKDGHFEHNDADLRLRMAHLVGIQTGVRKLFRDASRGYAWLRASNSAFGGKSAIDIMLSGKITDLAAVREWLAAETSN
jgi:hypothetical protein